MSCLFSSPSTVLTAYGITIKMLGKELDLSHLKANHFLIHGLAGLKTNFEQVLLQDRSIPILFATFATIFLLTCVVALGLFYTVTYHDGLPVVNRSFALEPRIFARLRWAFRARKILEKANDNVGAPSNRSSL